MPACPAGLWAPRLAGDKLPRWDEALHGSLAFVNSAMFTAKQLAVHVVGGSLPLGDPHT